MVTKQHASTGFPAEQEFESWNIRTRIISDLTDLRGSNPCESAGSELIRVPLWQLVIEEFSHVLRSAMCKSRILF
jgi:hypothetical protein